MTTPHETQRITLTREYLEQYYIDVLGYRRHEVAELTKGELIKNLSDYQLNECIDFNN